MCKVCHPTRHSAFWGQGSHLVLLGLHFFNKQMLCSALGLERKMRINTPTLISVLRVSDGKKHKQCTEGQHPAREGVCQTHGKANGSVKTTQKLSPRKWDGLQVLKKKRDFPGGLVVKKPLSNAGDVGLIPGWRTKIPHAAGKLSLCAVMNTQHNQK